MLKSYFQPKAAANAQQASKPALHKADSAVVVPADEPVIVEKKDVKADVVPVEATQAKMVKSVLLSRASAFSRAKGRSAAKGTNSFVTWVSDTRNIFTTSTGVCQTFTPYESLLGAQADFVALVGMFDLVRVRRAFHHYEPYRAYNMVVGASTAGSELAGGAPMAWRIDVEAESNTSALTMAAIVLSPPCELGGQYAQLGSVYGNTNRALKHKANFSDIKSPVVAQVASGAITHVGLGQWVDAVNIGAMAGGLFIACMPDVNASSNTTYGVLVSWLEVEFAVRV